MKQRPRWLVSPTDSGLRLDKFLAAPDRLGSRSRVAAALERGKVFIGDTEAGRDDGARRVRVGESISVWIDRPGSSARRPGPYKSGALHILYEDDSFIVLNKPAGMLSVPLERRPNAASAYGLIESHLRPSGKRLPLVVHRIDEDTSGLVVFAKTGRAQAALKQQFRRREPERVYRAVIYGHPEPADGTWRDRVRWDNTALVLRTVNARDARGVDAVATYRTLESFPAASLIDVRLVTGKQNQIRMQAALRGHQLVGESRYLSEPPITDPIAFPRQALHAHRLAFQHPVSGEDVAFDAPLPDDLAGLLARLRSTRGTEGAEGTV
jgi:23S rRNA pseudouridine1911/1915/1917 synthase